LEPAWCQGRDHNGRYWRPAAAAPRRGRVRDGRIDAELNLNALRKNLLLVSDFEQLGGRTLVIFDGRCGLCNGSVRWFLVRDRRDRLRFAPFESPKVAKLLAQHALAEPGTAVGHSAIPETILVVRDPGGPAEQLFVRSDAIVALLAELPRPWTAWAAVLGCIPRPLRDLGYRIIARMRYRVWGRLKSCPVPTSEDRTRFL
jgi:predicted DCC family thiol-disulfide oxidoreductase YuxK